MTSSTLKRVPRLTSHRKRQLRTPKTAKAVSVVLRDVLQAVDPLEAAKSARLRYVSDDSTGIRRVRSGKGFRYTDNNGRPVTDHATLARIQSLVIPPAWTAVWICPFAEGHLQATGHDARQRKQYRYHPRWREVRDEAKYGRMVLFGKALVRIRRHVRRDLRLPGMPKRKLLATLVDLLEKTLIRIGNEEYTRENGSFGLTTLQDRHAEIHGATIRFHFSGKSGKQRELKLTDQRLARLVKRCQDLPGHELFQYVDEEGRPQTIGSAEVNDYLREISGGEFTAKDFRTWAGTILAAVTLIKSGTFKSVRAGRRQVVDAIKIVAGRLGNTVAVCRKCYIHPAVLEAYLAGRLSKDFEATLHKRTGGRGLRSEEMKLLAFLEAQAAPRTRHSQAG
jgi:DNA topoisomerase-1